MTEETITVEEWQAQLNGTVHAILLAYTSMIATHPERKKILASLENLSSKHSKEEEGDNSQTKHYKLGIREAVSMIAYFVDGAQFATMPAQGKEH